ALTHQRSFPTRRSSDLNQQPYIGLWNLSCLAQALLPLAEKEDLKAALDRYTPLCEGRYMELMRAKFGLIKTKEDDASLIQEVLRSEEHTSELQSRGHLV